MKHRAFVGRQVTDIPEDALTIIAFNDLTFGMLNSAPHVIWATAKGTALGVSNDSRYTPTTTYETFAFPRPTDAQRAAIAEAARFLVTAREYLHQQSVPGRASTVKLSLTVMDNLLAEYRAGQGSPLADITTLADAHDTLDAAVAAAYGWTGPISTEPISTGPINTGPINESELLTRLLALNLERAGAAVGA